VKTRIRSGARKFNTYGQPRTVALCKVLQSDEHV